MTSQVKITSRGLRPTPELVPPWYDDFSVYGDEDTIERARRWATEEHMLLVEGVPRCAHAFYAMWCPSNTCVNSDVGFDHTEVWVSTEQPWRPFILTHPYVNEIPQVNLLAVFPIEWEDRTTA